MNNEEFIQVIESIKLNIGNLYEKCYEKCKNKEGVRRIGKVFDEFFSFEFKPDGHRIYIFCNSRTLDSTGWYEDSQQSLVCPLMLFYTEVSLRVLETEQYVEKSIYRQLCQEKDTLGKAIYNMCNKEFKQYDMAQNKCKEVKIIIEEATKTMKDSKLRRIYRSFCVGRKYIYFFDTICNQKKKVSINSSFSIYAIMMLFSQVYIETFLCDDSGTSIPWKLFRKFKHVIYF